MSEKDSDVTSPCVVPTPPFRPGDQADFGGEWTFLPEDLPRPDPATCDSSATKEHAVGLVRVLNYDNTASGEWDPKLDAETLKTGLEYMARLRIFDDRMMKMQRTGKLS
ncbi:MAG: hypothetical protein HOF90_05130, partial [Euryarchaeota archaeon]|nr:hypothetical protein [Euryarchaeota archaeon]